MQKTFSAGIKRESFCGLFIKNNLRITQRIVNSSPVEHDKKAPSRLTTSVFD